jgi:NADH-quinone oxidoreductase subunit M
MLYDRRHTKKFDEFGGLARTMPVFAFFLVFSALASVGLPALNGFVGEFLALVGAFRSDFMDLRWAVVLATFGVVLAAVYLLKMLLLTLWGPLTRKENEELSDLSAREVMALAPLCVFMLWIGLAPAAFLRPSVDPLDTLLREVRGRMREAPVTEATMRSAPPAAAEALVAGAAARRPAATAGGAR